ncbi:probable E3 ubiquitin-protein ligase HERC2 [Anguilla anguilla]|uniref:probable E3 ubiquitin-protein ligase HERC2 n=1 Tax=Anguilla anguilla TaxID=7936 RepID=UPI0015AE240C|nr:probable E3 ubiquitin-protein ligase HERC2 [Anguilla anguilla]
MAARLLQKTQAGLGEAMATSPSADAVRCFTSETPAVQAMSTQEAVCGPGVELLCWGSGDLGQTGRGGTRDVSPQRGALEAFTPGKLGRVKLLACGSCHSVVVTVDNRIFTWGNGSSGQLGNGERNMRDRPSEVFLPPGGSGADGGRAAEVAGVACGSRHTFIWTPSGEAFSFGNNFYAQLGHDFRKMDFKENQLVPHLFRNLPSQRITQVACGDRHTLFALEDGSVAVCGANDYGQIGSRSCEDAAVPRFVEDLENITSIACGANHNLALSGNGKVFQWGCGRACGNLRRNLPVPEEVPLPPVSVNAVRGGCWHSLLLTDDGKVYSWGMGQEGQLGQGQNMAFLSAPCLLQSGVLSPGVLQIEAGESYSAALTADGGLFAWGRSRGVMDAGRSGSQQAWSPERVPLGVREVCAVSCGTWHALALVRPRAEMRSGNRESHFRETGALFKEDSNYPQPMELEPRENSKQAPPAAAQPGDPVNPGEAALRRRCGNAPPGDMDKTDLLRSGPSNDDADVAAAAGAPGEPEPEPPGSGRSSITPPADDGGPAGPAGPGFRGGPAVGRLTPPPSPDGPPPPRGRDPGRPGGLPRLQGRRPPRRGSKPGQVSSRKPWVCDSVTDSSVAPSPRGLQQRSVPGAPPSRMLSPGPSPWRTRHLSPLNPPPRPRARPTSSPSLAGCQTPPVSPARPVHKQATYSSGTAWKDVSMSADPVLSHKRVATANGQKR